MASYISSSHLREIPLFDDLSECELRRVLGQLHPRIFGTNAVIVEEEEPGAVAYVIWHGYVRIETHHCDGNRTLLSILGPGEVVGELSVLDQLGRSATVVAHGAATLFEFQQATFWTLLNSISAMNRNLVGLLARRLRLADGQIQALAAMDVEARVARQLQVLSREFGECDGVGGITLPFRLTQEELADLIGASRVRVNQVLAEFRRDGMVSTDCAHRITIHQSAGLDVYWQ